MAVIFVASHQPTVGVAERVPDWISHGIAYAVLAFLMARAWGEKRALSLRAAALILLGCTAYGVSDEWHQSFVPGRHCDPWDVLKDLGGSVLGIALFLRSTRPAGSPSV